MNASIARQNRSSSELYGDRKKRVFAHKSLNSSVGSNFGNKYVNLLPENIYLLTFADERKPYTSGMNKSVVTRDKVTDQINTNVTKKNSENLGSENIPINNQTSTKKFKNTADKFINLKHSKEVKITKKKLEESIRETKQCTFKPQIDKKSQKITKELNYPGIDKLVTECKPNIISNYIPIDIDSERTIDIIEKSATIYLNRTQGIKINEKEMKILNQLINKKFN
jgi:hypothetical protein